MCTLPRTRKKPPATKYFASLRSCAASSSSGYGVVRSGGALPGMKRKIAAMTTPKNDAYVRNWSDERWRRYIRLLAEAGFQEVNDERPAEVEGHQDGEDDPAPPDRAPRVPDILPHVAVAEERPRGAHALAGHQRSPSE